MIDGFPFPTSVRTKRSLRSSEVQVPLIPSRLRGSPSLQLVRISWAISVASAAIARN
jgi:hypothetical protein